MSEKLILEERLEDQLENIYWDFENIKNQLIFLRGVCLIENYLDIKEADLDGYFSGKASVINGIEKTIEESTNQLLQIIKNEREKDER